MKKNMLLESINKQRKLMGLNELLDANIDAKGALSGNKLDLGIVPLEEMDPDAQDMADSDEIDLSDVDSSDDVNRHPDEDDFYRQQPGEDLSDTMDSRYPDPNERDWQMNRYSGQNEMMNEAELDELFGTGIGAGIKNAFQGIGQNFQAGRLTQQIKNAQAKFDKVIAQANTYLTKNEKIFNDLMSYQKKLASLNANDPNKKGFETVLNNSKTTWNALKSTLANANKQINQMNQAGGGETNQQAGGGQTGQTAPANIAVGDSVTYNGKKYTVDVIGNGQNNVASGNVKLSGINIPVKTTNVQKV